MLHDFDEDQAPYDSVNARARKLEEIAEIRAGTSAIQKIVQKHLSLVKEVRAKFPLDGVDLLSSNLKEKNNIVGDVSAEVGRLSDKVKVVIEEVASTIESGNYKPSEESIKNMSLGFNERERANKLLAADKDRLISCQSLNVAIEIFSELNQVIKQQIEDSEKAGDIQKERNLLLCNAILIYELTDFLINYIKNFRVKGIDVVKKTYNESQQRIATIKAELEELKQMAQADNVNPMTRDSTLADVAMREKAIELVCIEWDKYMDQVQGTQEDINKLSKSNIPTLNVIRANAKSQINVLELVAVLQIVNNSLGALQQALETLEGMDLVSLSQERVCRLLGIDKSSS